jgi:hypothetical protein
LFSSAHERKVCTVFTLSIMFLGAWVVWGAGGGGGGGGKKKKKKNIWFLKIKKLY